MQQGATAESSLIGQALDNKFRILRLIGRGGMGEVFEAEHTTLGKRVAIKLMLEKYTGDGEAVARFTREALAASRIGNPHIIDVSDIGTAPDGRAFVVMELLTGSPLSKVIEDGGPMPPQRAIGIMRQVLRAVHAAHAKGIVHRDLKPDNIFIIDGGEQPDFVKLLDFGISKMIDPDMQAAATKLTTTGVVMGTPLYMAPEQAMGVDVDHLADVYACGVIMYEMLAGRPPFEGATYAVLVAKLLTTEPQLLSELRPGLAPKLVAAVHRALEKEPKSRHVNAEAFAAALPSASSASAVELAGTMHSGQQIPVAPQPHGKKFPIVAVSLALAIGIATAAVVIVMQKESGSGAPAQTTTAPPAAAITPPPPKPVVTEIQVPSEVGMLEVKSRPPGATVIIDGTPYSGQSQVTLEAGKHTIRVELEGYQPAETEYEIVAGVRATIEPWLQPLPAGKAGTTKSQPATKINTSQITSTQIKTTPPRPGVTRPRPVDTTTGSAATTSATEDRPPRGEQDPEATPPPPPPIKHDGLKSTPVTPTSGGTKPNPY
ncbi:MAG: serine/threonine protein kinase [Myxococcales bacterium]|nr:serine/threonine protein kinase [Myxococcales bacterium]